MPQPIPESFSFVYPTLFSALIAAIGWLLALVLNMRTQLAEHKLRLDQKRQRIEVMQKQLDELTVSVRSETQRLSQQIHASANDLKAEFRQNWQELKTDLREMQKTIINQLSKEE